MKPLYVVGLVATNSLVRPALDEKIPKCNHDATVKTDPVYDRSTELTRGGLVAQAASGGNQELAVSAANPQPLTLTYLVRNTRLEDCRLKCTRRIFTA